MISYLPPNIDPRYFDMPTWEGPNELAFNVLTQKQSKFDSGIAKVRDNYNKHLNLNPNSEGAKKELETLMDKAKKDLTSMANLDFGLEENQMKANQVYKPITSNSYIMKDLAIGSTFKNAANTAMTFRDSKDADTRSQYNIYSHQNIFDEQQRLSKVQNEEELGNLDMSVSTYVPKPSKPLVERVTEGYHKLLGTAGGKSTDSIEGSWIKTITNGEDARNALTVLAQSYATGEDLAYYESWAKHDLNRQRQKFVQLGGKAEEFEEGQVKEAVQFEKEVITNQVNYNKQKLGYYEQQKERAKQIQPGETEEQAAQRVVAIEGEINKLKQFGIKLDSRLNATNPQSGEAYQNYTQKLRLNLPSALAQVKMNSTISEFANAYSAATYKSSIKQNDVEKQRLDRLNDLQVEQLKLSGKAALDKEGKDESGTDAKITSVEPDKFAVTEENIYEQVRKSELEFGNASTNGQISYVNGMIDLQQMSGGDDKEISGFRNTLQAITDKVSQGKGFEKISISDPAVKDVMTKLNINTDVTANELLNTLNDHFTKLEVNLDNDKTVGRLEPLQSQRIVAESNKKAGQVLLEKRQQIETKLINEGKISQDVVKVENGNKGLMTQEDYVLNNSFRRHDGSSVIALDLDDKGEELLLLNTSAPENLTKGLPKVSRYGVGFMKNIPGVKPNTYVYLKDVVKMQLKDPSINVDNLLSSDLNVNSFINDKKEEYKEKVKGIDKNVARELVEQGAVPGVTLDIGSNGIIGYQFNKAYVVSGSKEGDIVDKTINSIFTDVNKDKMTMTDNEGKTPIPEDVKNLIFQTLYSMKGTPAVTKSKGITVSISPFGKDGRTPSYNLRMTSDIIEEMKKTVAVKEDWDKVAPYLSNGVTINTNNINPEIEAEMLAKNPYALLVSTNPNKDIDVAYFDEDNYIKIRKSPGNPKQYKVQIKFKNADGSMFNQPKDIDEGNLMPVLTNAINLMNTERRKIKNAPKQMVSEEALRKARNN
jgi:hypothetical protein